MNAEQPPTLKKLRRKLDALYQYQSDIFRIGEDSEAADRELMRVMLEIGQTQDAIKEAMKAKP